LTRAPLSVGALPAGALAALLLIVTPLAGCTVAPARAGSRPAPDEAELAEFEQVLAANASATAALEQWCARRALAPVAEVRASLVDTPADPASAAAARTVLGLGPDEPLGFRHVRLDCGGTVLSEAYNWYVPARLTGEMNHTLESTRTPFGKVAAPLGYARELIESRRGTAGGCPPGVILSHRAMLRLPDGRPLAVLVECYTAANMGR